MASKLVDNVLQLENLRAVVARCDEDVARLLQQSNHASSVMHEETQQRFQAMVAAMSRRKADATFAIERIELETALILRSMEKKELAKWIRDGVRIPAHLVTNSNQRGDIRRRQKELVMGR